MNPPQTLSLDSLSIDVATTSPISPNSLTKSLSIQKALNSREHYSYIHDDVIEKYKESLNNSFTPENLDLSTILPIMDEKHFGMHKAKERLMEFLAVKKLTGKMPFTTLCLVGPPGIGKASFAKVAAFALNRKFYRINVSGVDAGDLRGARKSKGAQPGHILKALKSTGTGNPLILIEGIDALENGGDVMHALIDLLNSEKNFAFQDNFLNSPIDVSHILFLCSATDADSIPEALTERMEMIHVKGYTDDEKLQIGRKVLIPKAMSAAGLNGVDIKLDDSVIRQLIESYCRETGVNLLSNYLEKIFRKIALRKVMPQDGNDPVFGNVSGVFGVTLSNLWKLVGQPTRTVDRIYDETPIGVVMGLGCTSNGGCTLYVESIVVNDPIDGTSGFTTTGQMGSVMQESASIALSFVKSFMARNFPDNKFFDHADIHVHLPEGAVQKDGPSAGLAIASTLLSLALDTPIKKDIAMSGEVSLTGKVLTVGGIREKVLIAKRVGIKGILLPKANMADWLEMPSNVRTGMIAHFLDNCENLCKFIFDG